MILPPKEFHTRNITKIFILDGKIRNGYSRDKKEGSHCQIDEEHDREEIG